MRFKKIFGSFGSGLLFWATLYIQLRGARAKLERETGNEGFPWGSEVPQKWEGKKTSEGNSPHRRLFPNHNPLLCHSISHVAKKMKVSRHTDTRCKISVSSGPRARRVRFSDFVPWRMQSPSAWLPSTSSWEQWGWCAAGRQYQTRAEERDYNMQWSNIFQLSFLV